MKEINTHYNNLKVARNAPQEVIRAAYMALSKQYHPDRNSGSSESNRIMSIINASYEVLSDPIKRRDHDSWILKMEEENKYNSESLSRQDFSSGKVKPTERSVRKRFSSSDRWIGLSTLFIIVASVCLSSYESSPSSVSQPYTPEPVETSEQEPRSSYQEQASPSVTENTQGQPKSVALRIAPNGQAWPKSAGYVKGYEKLNMDGLSTVTVDNSQNNTAVFVKLISSDGSVAYPVRQFYIPAFGGFILRDVSKGNYDIRYRDLSDGRLSRSDSFNVEEIETSEGKQFSNITMTLYKMQNGNFKTYPIQESDF
ncbi:MAG: J domain-containing protein [Candidatus Saccharibacteria bacterium]|nr:J domain-containing protein [Moraxellaceae bacterium]